MSSEFLGGDAWVAAVGGLGDTPGKQRNTETLGPASGPVCVTGASGFLALELVTQLLEGGFTVVGTVRSESNAVKMAPLKALQEKFGEKLRIVSGVDLMKEETFGAAIEGCVGVFHTASPFTYETDNPLEDLVKPAKLGTVACLGACKKVGGVKRVIVTSSVAAVAPFGQIAPDQTLTSKDWNTTMSPQADGTFLNSHVGYFYSKTNAEKSAWDFAAAEDCTFDLSTICPPYITGRNFNRPESEKDLNTSSAEILSILRGEQATQSGSTPWVDVEIVAASHITAYVRPEAGGKRWVCASETVSYTQLAKMLKEIRPDCPVQTTPPSDGEGLKWSLDSSGLESLGVQFKPLIETLKVQAESLVAMGYLPAKP